MLLSYTSNCVVTVMCEVEPEEPNFEKRKQMKIIPPYMYAFKFFDVRV